MALDMRALYYVALPTERSEADDVQRHEEDIKANEKYSLQGTTQGRYLTGGVPPVRFSM